MSLDHQAYYNGEYNDRKYSQDLYDYHAYSMDPSLLDENFFDTMNPHNISVHYAIADIDGDGQEELLLGTSDNGGEVEIKRTFFYDRRKMACVCLDLEVATCLKDGTIIIQEGNGGEVVGIMRFADSMPVPAKDPDFQLGFPQDYMAFMNTIERRGVFMPDNWIRLDQAGGEAAPNMQEKAPQVQGELLENAASFDDVLYTYSVIGNSGIGAGDGDCSRKRYRDYAGLYEERYRYTIGTGAIERLNEISQDGVHTFTIYALDLDADGDGRMDLSVGTGVTADRMVTPVGLYFNTAEGIVYVDGKTAMETYEIPTFNKKEENVEFRGLSYWE